METYAPILARSGSYANDLSGSFDGCWRSVGHGKVTVGLHVEGEEEEEEEKERLSTQT